jgi:hypothetical protein
VWDARTTPALVRRWLLGPPGWELPVRETDLRVGGKYRYDWVDKGRDEESRPEEGGASEDARLEGRSRRLPGGFHHYRSIPFDRKRI